MKQLSTMLPLELMQTRWASTLNPLLALPIVAGIQIDNISLVSGVPMPVNHLLSRMPQGWIVTDIDSNAAVWRSAPFNKSTLVLESNDDVTISIWVY